MAKVSEFESKIAAEKAAAEAEIKAKADAEAAAKAEAEAKKLRGYDWNEKVCLYVCVCFFMFILIF